MWQAHAHEFAQVDALLRKDETLIDAGICRVRYNCFGANDCPRDNSRMPMRR